MSCYAEVSKVEVVGLCRIFSSERVDLLNNGHDAGLLTTGTNGHDCLFDVHFLFHTHGTGNLEVSEALYFGTAEQFVVEYVDRGASVKFFIREMNFVELLQEPFVDFG